MWHTTLANRTSSLDQTSNPYVDARLMLPRAPLGNLTAIFDPILDLGFTPMTSLHRDYYQYSHSPRIPLTHPFTREIIVLTLLLDHGSFGGDVAAIAVPRTAHDDPTS